MTTLGRIEVRQLGTLHQRAAYLLALMRASEGFSTEHPAIHHAAWDLVDMLRQVPDMAYEDGGSGPIVPLDKARRPKLGIVKSARDILAEVLPIPVAVSRGIL